MEHQLSGGMFAGVPIFRLVVQSRLLEWLLRGADYSATWWLPCVCVIELTT